METARFVCDGLPTGDVIVSDIREEVPESMVCRYFGKKSSKSGWDYREHTTVAEQAAIKDLYFRVYDCPEPPNREITLAFARGLISMSLGRRVNWAQFSAERRKVREALRKKAEAMKEKRQREGENVEEESPAVLGKKRLSVGCPQFGFPQSLFLTPKSEEVLEGAAMVKKSLSRSGRHGVPPSWGPEEVEGLGKVIASMKLLLQEAMISLEQGREELVSVEDRLRRGKLLRSDRQAMLSESKKELLRLGEQERALRGSVDVKAARLRELELFNDSTSREELDLLAVEVSRLNAEIESILFKKGLEESAIRMYVTAIAGCEDTVAEMEATKLERSAKHSQVESRVSSFEKSILAMEEQMCRMRAGDGAAFFPLPLLGSPESPVVVTHNLNACPVCSLWFSCYDYSSLACGHTYHPYCLYEHAQKATTCAVAACQEPFGLQSLRAIGIRPIATTALSKRPVEKPRAVSTCNEMLHPSQSVTGSGCEPTSSWEKEAPIHASQESSQKPIASKILARNNNREELPTYKATTSDDSAPTLNCTLCRSKEASVYIMPCGHDVFCFGCTQGLLHCPICRVEVSGWGATKKKGKENPFLPIGRSAVNNQRSNILVGCTSVEGQGLKSQLTDASKEQDAEREEAEYVSSDNDDYTRTWCTSDVFLQGGSRSEQDVDVELAEERSAELGEDQILSEGDAQMEVEKEVPISVGVPSMNKSLKRFAAVSDLVAAEGSSMTPTASTPKRRQQVSQVSSASKKAIQDDEVLKKKGVGRPRLNSGSRASAVSKDTSASRTSHQLRTARRKRDMKDIIPAKFR